MKPTYLSGSAAVNHTSSAPRYLCPHSGFGDDPVTFAHAASLHELRRKAPRKHRATGLLRPTTHRRCAKWVICPERPRFSEPFSVPVERSANLPIGWHFVDRNKPAKWDLFVSLSLPGLAAGCGFLAEAGDVGIRVTYWIKRRIGIRAECQ